MVTQRSSKHLIRAYDSCIWYMAYFAIWTLEQKANSSLFNKLFLLSSQSSVSFILLPIKTLTSTY